MAVFYGSKQGLHDAEPSMTQERAKRKKGGRRKGGHNKGYWFRKGRGWYVTEGSNSLPLLDGNGQHIKAKEDRESC